MNTLYPRWQQKTVEQDLANFRIVLLSGPRQCGKTTLVKNLGIGGRYLSLDEPYLLKLAKNDPMEFIRHGRGMFNKEESRAEQVALDFATKPPVMMIDEVQRAPELVLPIKLAVDEDNRPGQFLLTGSADLQSLPRTEDSLAGRVVNIRLRPLTQGEKQGRKPLFFKHMFRNDFGRKFQVFSRDQILEMAFQGGFPEAFSKKNERKKWYGNYMNALLARDLRDIKGIQRRSSMRKLSRVLAACSSGLIDISKITSRLEIARPTVESYLEILEQLYLFERVPFWSGSDYGRTTKREKLFLSDSGLMSAVLGWGLEWLRGDSRAGKLVETFVFNELAAQAEALDEQYTIFHYRNWGGEQEVDFIVENEADGALLGIEVKAGTTIHEKDFRHLKWFKKNIVKDGRPFTGVVLYSGDSVLRFGENLWMLPFSYLWAQ